jgi:superfamily I DNA and RNA helicase
MDTPDGFPKNRYDTILIDESQDLSEAIFLLLDKLARPTASWFISYGKGQEIWSFNKENPAPWLQNWLKSAEKKQLRRSFRNSTRAFLMAQNFWENYPDIDKSAGWIESKLKLQSDKQDAWALDLALPKDTNDFKVIRLSGGDNRKNSIKSVILGAIEDTRLADRGMDILISVGSEIKSSKYNSVIQSSSYSEILEVLAEIAETINLDVLDLVNVNNRRLTPKAGTIRIVRHQNIRGISASHVILFDLDLLEIWSQQLQDMLKAPIQNYGYIALSRSRASTLVAIRNDSDSNIENYIEKTLTIVRQKFLENSVATSTLQ